MNEPTAYLAFLSYLAECGRISRVAIDLLGYSRNNTWLYLQKLEADGLITSTGKKRNQSYRLTVLGAEKIKKYNDIRYGNLGDLLCSVQKRYAPISMASDMRRSEIIVASSLSGFSTQLDDKPFLHIASKIISTRSERPAHTAHIASLHTDTPIGENTKNFERHIVNYTEFNYYDEEEEREEKRKYDLRNYRTRKTVIGCYYSRDEINTVFEEERDLLKGELEKEVDRKTMLEHYENIRYSVVDGILFTGNGLYKLYGTRNTALRLRRNGERNMTVLLDSLGTNTYKRSLEDVPSIFNTAGVRGSVLFGDKSYRAVENILKGTMRAKENTPATKRSTVNYNLMDIPETFYIPLISEALPIYSMMIYPHFEEYLRHTARDYYKEVLGEELTPYINSYGGNVQNLLWDSTLPDGRLYCCMVPLKIDRLFTLLMDVTVDSPDIVIACMDYEVEFYGRLSEIFSEEIMKKIEIEAIPSSFLTNYTAGHLQDSLDYSGPFSGRDWR